MENIRLLFHDWFRQTTNNGKQRDININMFVSDEIEWEKMKRSEKIDDNQSDQFDGFFQGI